MAKHKLPCFAVFFCCIPLFVGAFASAQSFPGSHYSTTNPTMSFIDNTSACVVGRSQCWKQITSGLAIHPWSNAMAVTADGQVFASGTDNKLYHYANGAWQLFSSAPTGATGIGPVAARSSKDIYVSTYPVGGLYHYNGTSWTSVGIKANLVSEGSDGTVYIQTADGSNTLETLSNGTWTQVAYPSGHGYITSLSVGSKNNVWLILQDGTIWVLNFLNGTFDGAGPSPGTTQPVTVVTTGLQPGTPQTLETWLITANNGTVANNVFMYNWSNGTWTAMTGLLSTIASGGHSFTAGARSDLATTYHFNPLKLSVSATTTGSFDCTRFACPPNAVHTGSTTITFGSGGHTSTAQNAAGIIPGSQVTGTIGNVTALADTEDCDPFYTQPNDPDCQVHVSGVVICSAMGAIFAANAIFNPPVLRVSLTANGAVERNKPKHYLYLTGSGNATITATLTPSYADPNTITWTGGTAGGDNLHRIVSLSGVGSTDVTAYVSGVPADAVRIHVIDASAPPAAVNDSMRTHTLGGAAIVPNDAFGLTVVSIGQQGVTAPTYQIDPYFNLSLGSWVFRVRSISHSYKEGTHSLGRIDLPNGNPPSFPLAPGLNLTQSHTEARDDLDTTGLIGIGPRRRSYWVGFISQDHENAHVTHFYSAMFWGLQMDYFESLDVESNSVSVAFNCDDATTTTGSAAVSKMTPQWNSAIANRHIAADQSELPSGEVYAHSVSNPEYVPIRSAIPNP